ncbi:MAG: hypothetical protein WC479_10075 [Candidatus Izemoplasmatales bacterium]
MEQRCTAKVYPKEQWGAFHPSQCSKKGIVERGGKWYCKIHDPQYRQAKVQARLDKMNAQYEAGRKDALLKAASKDMYEALKLAIPVLVKHNIDDSCTEALSTIYAVINKADGKGE